MAGKADHAPCLMIFQEIVLFQDAPDRLNYVALPQAFPLPRSHEPAHVPPCGRMDEPSGLRQFRELGRLAVAHASAREGHGLVTLWPDILRFRHAGTGVESTK